MYSYKGKIKTEKFCVDRTLGSGQCFRWENNNGTWEGVVKNMIWRVQQSGIYLRYEIISELKIKNARLKIRKYFSLDVDYGEILREISVNQVMKKTVRKNLGMRMLNQDAFEILISFIISQNNNIPQIKLTIFNLCKKFGKEIRYKDGLYYLFPKPKVLVNASLKRIRQCGVGFRDRYIKEVAKAVITSEPRLSSLKSSTPKSAEAKLICLSGVGSKVAAYVMAFGLGVN